MDIGNAIRSMSIGNQDRFNFQMSRVLSIARLLEVRCQGLFSGLIDAQRNGREEGAKKKKARREREDMRSELTAAQADIAKAASTLASVRQQYCKQIEDWRTTRSHWASCSMKGDPLLTTSSRT